MRLIVITAFAIELPSVPQRVPAIETTGELVLDDAPETVRAVPIRHIETHTDIAPLHRQLDQLDRWVAGAAR